MLPCGPSRRPFCAIARWTMSSGSARCDGLGRHEADEAGELFARGDEAVGTEMLGEIEDVALLRRERIEPATPLVDYDDDFAVAAPEFHGAAGALLQIDLPAGGLEDDRAGHLLAQIVDFMLLHPSTRGTLQARARPFFG
jgi:hypothetical protein